MTAAANALGVALRGGASGFASVCATAVVHKPSAAPSLSVQASAALAIRQCLRLITPPRDQSLDAIGRERTKPKLADRPAYAEPGCRLIQVALGLVQQLIDARRIVGVEVRHPDA